jgi:hypothetical protein
MQLYWDYIEDVLDASHWQYRVAPRGHWITNSGLQLYSEVAASSSGAQEWQNMATITRAVIRACPDIGDRLHWVTRAISIELPGAIHLLTMDLRIQL